MLPELVQTILWLPQKLLCKRRRNLSAVAVVVLGDVGRSPRTAAQAAFLAEAAARLNPHSRPHQFAACDSSTEEVWSLSGESSSPAISGGCLRRRKKRPELWRNEPRWRTYLLGFFQTPAPVQLARTGVRTVKLLPAEGTTAEERSLWGLLCRVCSLSWQLGRSLARIPALAAVVVQNPPAVPTLPVAWLFCRLRGAALIIDWHNFGYTLVENKLERRLYKIIEQIFARTADVHFCVTATMREELVNGLGLEPIRTVVLPDAPAAALRPLSLIERHALAYKYLGDVRDTPPQSLVFAARAFDCRWRHSGRKCTVPGKFERWNTLARRGVDCSTGCNRVLDPEDVEEALRLETEDEMAVTLSAPISPSFAGEESPISRASPIDDMTVSVSLKKVRPAVLVTSTSYTKDERLDWLVEAMSLYERGKSPTMPDVILLITGKGAGRDAFVESIRALSLKHVSVCSLFVSCEEYPRVIGLADLFVCLHASSSGVDFPMKLMDARGIGAPAVSVSFAAMREYGQGEWNRLFDSAQGLADCLFSLLDGFPAKSAELQIMQKAALNQRPAPWAEIWPKVALPALSSILAVD